MFLVLDNFNINDDECKRQLYVAITRTKTNLTIHYNGNYLRNIVVNNLTYSNDNFIYPAPQYVSYLLSHRDVKLGYFAFVQHRMQNLVSGSSLLIQGEGLANTNNEMVVKFSNNFAKYLLDLQNKGYKPDKAKANFLVYWKDSDSDKEVKIVLPELSFVKQ